MTTFLPGDVVSAVYPTRATPMHLWKFPDGLPTFDGEIADIAIVIAPSEHHWSMLVLAGGRLTYCDKFFVVKVTGEDHG